MLDVTRNEEFQFIYLTKTILKTTSNAVLGKIPPGKIVPRIITPTKPCRTPVVR